MSMSVARPAGMPSPYAQYAGPMPTYAGVPASTYASAPMMSSPAPVAYAPQHMMQQAPSFQALPPVHQAYASVPAPTAAPQSMLQGVPDPASVEAQKAQYLRSIDEQLRQAQTLLDQQCKQQIEYMRQNAEQQKKQFSFQKDSQGEQERMRLNQGYIGQVNQLEDAARMQKLTLEQQSTQLIADYNQRKMHEALMTEQYTVQKRAFDAQAQLQAAMAKMTAPQAAMQYHQ